MTPRKISLYALSKSRHASIPKELGLSFAALIAVCSAVATGQAEAPRVEPKRFDLPATSRVRVQSITGRDKKDPTSESCADFRVTESEVRKMFATYRELKSREVHDDYIWAPCYVDGTIWLAEAPKKGPSFTFRVRPGNTLETNFPSGKSVILGGQPTDSPSGE